MAKRKTIAPHDALTDIRYIESSALVAALLERDTRARTSLRAPGRRVTSALTFAETARALLRAKLLGRLTQNQERAALRTMRAFERRCAVMPVTSAVLDRVGRSFPVEPVRTLDAVHLATAELLGGDPPSLTIVTRDERIANNARAIGYACE